MMYVIVLFCAANVDCGMTKPFRGITYYPTAEMCIASAKVNFPFYISNGHRYSVRCEPVQDKDAAE